MPSVLCLLCDVRIENEVKSAIRQTIDRFGTIHVCITAAGISIPGLTLTSKSSLDMTIFTKHCEVNLFGTMYAAKHAAI